jgi:subtilisin family serine protease
VWVGWTLIFTLKSALQDTFNLHAVALAGFLWTLSTLLVVTLWLGGVSLFRHRVAARGVLFEIRKPLPKTLPIYTGTLGALCLMLVYFGLPSPFVVGRATVAGAEFVAEGLTAAADAWVAEGEPRALLALELGPDDELGEVAGPLLMYNARVEQAFPNADDADLAATWWVEVPQSRADGLIRLLAADAENVDAIEADRAVNAAPLGSSSPCERAYLSSALTLDDPYAGGQHELRSTGALDVMSTIRTATAGPVYVAVIDTGVDGTHEDLAAAMARAPYSNDAHGHGTAVAGALAAVAGNGRGGASINVEGRVIRVLAYDAVSSGGSAFRVANALYDAVDDGAKVAVMSFGADGPAPAVVANAVRYAIAHDVALIAAAGNDPKRSATNQWPANIPGVLVVGATDRNGRPSIHGSAVDRLGAMAWAPGSGVCVPIRGGGYGRVDGSSFAAPIVAGHVATYRAVCPGLSAQEALILAVSSSPSPTQWGDAYIARVDRGLRAAASKLNCR